MDAKMASDTGGPGRTQTALTRHLCSADRRDVVAAK